MKVNFRRMKEKDVSQVVKIECDLFPGPWSRNSFLTEIKNSVFSYPFVLYSNDQIIGYSNCRYYFSELHIGNFAIKRDYQKQGFGRLLLTKILEYFSSYKRAFLEVGVSNTNAFTLYSKFGFEVISMRKSYYSNGEDAYVMSKSV